jgi:hypothetical protein
MSLFQEIISGAKSKGKLLDNISVSVKLNHPEGNVGISAKTGATEIKEESPEGLAAAIRTAEKARVQRKLKFDNSTGTLAASVTGEYASEAFLKHENGG